MNNISKAMFLFVSFSIINFLWFIGFQKGISTAVSVWYISEIYNHCFLIIPCVFYFIYQKKQEILKQEIIPNFWLIPPLLIIFIMQLFAEVGDINILMHISTFIALPLMIWLFYGNSVCKVVAFPLFIIVFSIPIGDQLVPYLQELTTDLAVPLLEMTGVPIYRNGLYLDIPEGRFLVAEACSGISFLITSIAFGFIYSYVSFNSIPKRILFIAVSFIVPIVANALRVYGIILTGHLSNMEHAVGADHLIYGGIFYGIVLFILILIGERFRDQTLLKVEQADDQKMSITRKEQISVITVLLLLIVIISAQRIWLHQVKTSPATINDLHRIEEKHSLVFVDKKIVDWEPLFSKASLEIEGVISNDYNSSEVYIAYFDEINGELISSQHRFFNDKYWSLLSRKTQEIGENNLNHLMLISPTGQQRQLFFWYQVNDKSLVSSTRVKLYQTYQKLINKNASGSIFMFTMPIDDQHNNYDPIKQLMLSKTEIINVFNNQIYQNIKHENQD